MAILKDCQMLEVEINSIRWNLSDLCSVAFVGIVIVKLLSRPKQSKPRWKVLLKIALVSSLSHLIPIHYH